MHIEKAKAGQFIGLALHDERACENHSNEKIDPSRSHLNYNLCDGNIIANYNARMENVYMRKNKDANVIVMISNTLPKDFPEERKNEFFKYSHEFFCDFFGKENVISDWVHGDETSWHQHVKAIPTYFNEKKQRETVSFDRVMTRSVYKSMHKDLQNHLEKKMGIPVPILNGATAGGNKSIQELKAADLEKENERLEKEIKYQEECLEKKTQEYREVAAKLHDTESKLEMTQQELYESKQYVIELEQRIQRTEEKVEEVKEAVEEVQNFAGTTEANWVARFLEEVRKTLKTARESKIKITTVNISVNALESLEKALQPFLRLKEKVQELVHEFKGVKDLIERAKIKHDQQSTSKKIKTRSNDLER